MWKAFIHLHMARGSSGFGPLPISPAAIQAHLDLCGIMDREARMELYEMISVLDNEWRILHSEEQKKKGEVGKRA